MACLPEGTKSETTVTNFAETAPGEKTVTPDTIFVRRRPTNLPGVLAFNAAYARKILALPQPRADVMYVRFGHWQFSPPLLARPLGMPLVVEVNGVPDADRKLSLIHRFLINRILRAADRLVVTSQLMAEHFVRHFGVDYSRCRVVENGVDIELYRPRPEVRRQITPPGRPVIGYVGTLAPYWGLDLLWRSAPGLVREFPDLVIAVAGSGPMAENLRNQFAARGLTEHLRILGPLSYEDAAQLMAECDVLVAPLQPIPRNEMSSPIKVYHYLATGTPVVATRMEVMEQFREGGIRLFEPENQEDFARAIGEALRMTALDRQTAAHRQHTFISERFTWDHTVDRLEEVLREVVRSE